ncbi:hypothetical protein SAMN02745181_0512 [Rubritalea squalenifaciens DSM 18772]|uniref:HEAT repeat domain-containing protein n=1 Tax=Rubritalea squalenifaciens DSM 18772 TaxID=1123071 RepID=A0A1M6CMB0_9BACT|nr:HEAT repeat domain-containing protein [Rubritalea squalenifaciens]SHI61924.1 hypothetical protein SAMN02745181_0512 [Rubritalea squalenifaciens DSM 18772]
MSFSKSPLIVIFVLLTATGATHADEPASLKESIARIHEVASAKKYYDLSEKEKALIKEISEIGPDALPHLAELLKHDKRAVTVVAAEAIEEIARGVDSIDAKFLPAILHGLDNDHSGLPNVLAKIRTKKARVEYLSRYLSDRTSPGNQYQNGFSWYGAEFLPSIVETIRSDSGLSSSDAYLLGAALRNFPEKDGKAAAQQLMKLVEDRNTKIQTKRAVLTMIGNLGPPALVVEDRILTIWENQQDFRSEAESALVGIRSKKTGVILADQLKSKPDLLLLRDIAEVGPAAESAGTQVAELLDHSDWELRLGAARTIGFIGYHGADARLVELVNEPSDVRLNWVAAETLGRLKSKDALKALNDAAKKHWHPAVRNTAKTAVSKIESNSNYELKHHKENFPFEYYDYEYMGIELPADYHIPAVVDPSSLSARQEAHPELIGKLTYPSEIVSYGASDEEEQKAEQGDDVIIAVNEGNMVEHRRKISVTPDVGIRVPKGWLLGSDRGEWGGELVFKGDDSEHYKILEENIDGIYKLGERYIAVTGLSHLTLNDGIIYELKFVDGKWRAERWRALPGAPRSSGQLKSGDVMVVTSGGGIVVLSANGDFRMAANTPKPERSTK